MLNDKQLLLLSAANWRLDHVCWDRSMLTPEQAAKIMARADVELGCMRRDGREHPDKVDAAEKRAAVLLNILQSFTDNPEFKDAYDREIAAGMPKNSAAPRRFLRLRRS